MHDETRNPYGFCSFARLDATVLGRIEVLAATEARRKIGWILQDKVL